MLRSATMVLCLVLCGRAIGQETLVIAPRQATVPAPPSAAATGEQLTDVLRKLGGDEARQDERYESLRQVARAVTQASDQVVDRLDATKYPDWLIRRGALRSVLALGINGPRVSSAVAWTAARDPEQRVRNEAVETIRTRGDRLAGDLLVRHLMDAFGARGEVAKPDQHDNAMHALRTLGDRRFAEALTTYVFAEIRTGVSVNRGMGHQHIRSVGGEGTVYPVDLPIEQPNIEVMEFQGTVVIPALAALRSLTGQDFGENREQWQRWIRTHPPADWR